MFIVNVNDINENYLFICDKHLANIIMQHNIPLLGIYNNKYYFMKNSKIYEIISKGGEKDNE